MRFLKYLMIVLGLVPLMGQASTFTVTNTNDEGAGSLRQAIIDANSDPDFSTINFAIQGSGPFTINPSTILPTLTTKILIDGFSQSGNGVYQIVLDGSFVPNNDGISVYSNNANETVIKGLLIKKFWYGVNIYESSNCQILDNVINSCSAGIGLTNAHGTIFKGNKVGTDESGTVSIGNATAGINSYESNNLIIGGGKPGEQNIFSGGGMEGIKIEGCDGLIVQGNKVGTDISGTQKFGNITYGVGLVNCKNVTLGGSVDSEGNLISANGESGLFMDNCDRVTVKGNKIGTDGSGMSVAGNMRYGIVVYSSNDIVIGGAGGAEGNLISGNNSSGVSINSNSSMIKIAGNFIGVNASGTAALGNRNGGILIINSNNAIVGGIGGEGNLISGNYSGIEAQFSNNIVIKGNKIGTNSAGTSAIPNTAMGLRLSRCNDGIIGGSVTEGNLISGNHNDGINIASGSLRVIIKGNKIGTDFSGSYAIANFSGISIIEGSNQGLIGGANDGDGNLISGNTTYGIEIQEANNVAVKGNKIGTNNDGTVALGNGINGISIEGANTIIGGVSLPESNIISGNLGSGISINGNFNVRDVTITGNKIGTDISGNVQIGNKGNGIEIYGGAQNIIIGGGGSNEGNLISGNYSGINIMNGLNVIIKGNKIGTNFSGQSAVPNNHMGISATSSQNVLIGDKNSGEGNLISANLADGLLFRNCSQSFAKGNKIGTDISGTVSIGNQWAGVALYNSNNVAVGSEEDGGGNLISGNAMQGYYAESCHALSIKGNKIGTNVSGSLALGNMEAGIFLYSSSDVVIGGGQSGEGNLVSGNGKSGIALDNVSLRNVIQGNTIGTDITGTSKIPNLEGVSVGSGSDYTIVGGSNAGEGNLISGNTNIGCSIGYSNHVTVKGNKIGTNISGNVLLGNGRGLSFSQSISGIIGGSSKGEGNLISGNISEGIVGFGPSSDWNIKGNIIGTDVSGTIALPNATGIALSEGISNITLGGAGVTEGNLISGNTQRGCDIRNAQNIIIKGNKIGTDVTGILPLLNGTNAGIYLGNSFNINIGGGKSGEGNVLDGVEVFTCTQVSVKGNVIGANVKGTASLDKASGGVIFLSSADCQVGGSGTGEGNIIDCRSHTGISCYSSSLISVRGNKITSDLTGSLNADNNTGILFQDVTSSYIGGQAPGEANSISGAGGWYGIGVFGINSPGNRNRISATTVYGFKKAIYLNIGGSAGNNSKPAPTITSLVSFRSGLSNKYIVTGTSESNNLIEIFASDGGPQNAIRFIGQVTADQNGNWNFEAPRSFYKNYFVATATDVTPVGSLPKNNTSELSNMVSDVSVDCEDCIGSFAPEPGKKYVISGWVKEEQAIVPVSYTNSGISLTFTGSGQTIGPFNPTGKIIDGWQRIEAAFDVPLGSTEIKVNLHNTNSSDVNVYFDDIRVHPHEGNMKSFVYDPITRRLVAELDENNYATFYEYDEEGSLIRVKKETERGIMTIKETRGNLQK